MTPLRQPGNNSRPVRYTVASNLGGIDGKHTVRHDRLAREIQVRVVGGSSEVECGPAGPRDRSEQHRSRHGAHGAPEPASPAEFSFKLNSETGDFQVRTAAPTRPVKGAKRKILYRVCLNLYRIFGIGDEMRLDLLAADRIELAVGICVQVGIADPHPLIRSLSVHFTILNFC